MRSFWDKNHFTSRNDLLRKSPKFLNWYETYALPVLEGLTVGQASRWQPLIKLLRRQIRQIPQELPLTAWQVHFIRKVDVQEPGLIKQYEYEINEPVRSLLLQYNRRARKIDILKRI